MPRFVTFKDVLITHNGGEESGPAALAVSLNDVLFAVAAGDATTLLGTSRGTLTIPLPLAKVTDRLNA